MLFRSIVLSDDIKTGEQEDVCVCIELFSCFFAVLLLLFCCFCCFFIFIAVEI